MTAYARVITIGRNSDMPKVVKIPVGVGIDGSAIRAPMTIRGDECICPACEGWGTDSFWNDRCERCDGNGIVEIDQDEDTSAASWCLSTAEVGRSLSPPGSGRPPSSGMKPDARATGDLSRSIHNEERGTHSTLRSVPSSSASDRPAADMPPIALQGTLERVLDGLTVVGGLAVFSAIAWFCLVLSV